MIRIPFPGMVASIAGLWLACHAGAAAAAAIRILAGSAIDTTMSELIPGFEKVSGHKVSFDFDGAIGAMTERVRRGETADVVIVSARRSTAWRRTARSSQGAAPTSRRWASAC